MERKKNHTEAPTVLGIDEKHLNNDIRGILVNVETGKLLDILEKNDRESMINGIKKVTFQSKLEFLKVNASGRDLN